MWGTEHQRVVRCGPRYADADWLGARLERLQEIVADADADGARAELERIVPGIRVDSGTEATVGV